MKIYFVYRSAYESISRYMKEFEENSILEWFQTNWNKLSNEDEFNKLLGLYVYGFPISKIDDYLIVPPPDSLEDLKNKLDQYVYLNEIKVTENCVEVITDDDEIGLAWYVFDEIFVQNNPEKSNFWLIRELPIKYSNKGKLLNNNEQFNEILPKGHLKGCLYLGLVSDKNTCEYYFSAGLLKIENIRLPNLLEYLRNNSITISYVDKNRTLDYGYKYLIFLQYLAQNLPNEGLHRIIESFCKLTLSHLTEDLDEPTIKRINQDITKDDNWSLKRFTHLSEYQEMMSERRYECFKPFKRVSEHLCEWAEIFESDFYNYFVIFDDLWVGENEILAENISRFYKSEWL